jgi:hypothetical protein
MKGAVHMKNQKSIRETLSKEKLKEVEEMIASTKNKEVKHLMKQLLFMTFEELNALKKELERQGYWKDDEEK